MANDLIKMDSKNYLRHNDKNKDLIKKSLKECGAGRSIVIDNDNEIVAGNGVYEQAKALDIPIKVIETDGSELVVVKRTDLKTKDEKRKKLALMDNSASGQVEWDLDNIRDDFDLEDLEAMGVSLDLGDDSKKDIDIETKEVKIIFSYKDSPAIIEKFIEEVREKYPELMFEMEISD